MTDHDPSDRLYVRGGGRGECLAVGIGAAVLVGLALALGAFLLPACAITAGVPFVSDWFDACPQARPTGPSAIDREADRANALLDRIARLERKLAGLPACPPQRVAALPPPAPETAPQPPPHEPQSEPEPEPPLPQPQPEPEPEPPPPQPQPEPEPEPPQPEPESEFDRRLKDEGGEVSEELTVTLIWDDTSDLDLVVTCPNGGRVDAEGSVCGSGVLDVDANGYGTDRRLRMMDRPVENIRFGLSAPLGTYGIAVTIAPNYAAQIGRDQLRNLGRHPFSVRVTSRGQEQVFDGVHPGLGAPDVRFSFEH